MWTRSIDSERGQVLGCAAQGQWTYSTNSGNLFTGLANIIF